MPRPANDQVDDAKYWLRQVFNNHYIKMTDGVELPVLRPRFLEILNHACPCSQPFLTRRQRDVLTLLYTNFERDGEIVRYTVSEVAELLGVPERTVHRDHRLALEAIAEQVNDPVIE